MINIFWLKQLKRLGLSPGAQLLYLSMRSEGGTAGVCETPIEEIARQMDRPTRNIYNQKAKLAEVGAIKEMPFLRGRTRRYSFPDLSRIQKKSNELQDTAPATSCR